GSKGSAAAGFRSSHPSSIRSRIGLRNARLFGVALIPAPERPASSEDPLTPCATPIWDTSPANCKRKFNRRTRCLQQIQTTICRIRDYFVPVSVHFAKCDIEDERL